MAEDDQVFLSEEDKAALSLLGVEGDISDTTVAQEVSHIFKSVQEKKQRRTEPPRPDHRDGMGGYKVPPGGKPLTVNDIPGPGPNSYYPETNAVVKKYPQWSFGEKETDKTAKKRAPGPNSYDIRGSLKWGRCKQFTLRPRIEIKDSRITFPGPTAYSFPDNLFSGPKFSIRLKPKSEFAPGLFSKLAYQPDPNNPGPDYNIPSDEWLKKPKSFGVRLPELKKPVSPGPQKYMCRDKFQGPKWVFGDKHDSKKRPAVVPGPQAYTLKSTIGDAPKFSMGFRFKPSKSKFITPGPDVYNSAGIRLDEPGYTMKYRWFEPRPEQIPAPYSYSDDRIKKKFPAYTMGIKGKLSYPSNVYSNLREFGPPPTRYNVPRDPLNKGKSIAIMTKRKDTSEVPGPADYQDIEKINVIMPKAPSFSMGGTWKKKIETGPGPSHYKVKFPDVSIGKTFGVKPEKKATAVSSQPVLYPVDIATVCRPCEFLPGPTLKGRHTPHKYIGLKDSSLIPCPPKDFPSAPLFG